MPNLVFPDDVLTVNLAADDYILFADHSDDDNVKRLTGAGLITFADGYYLNKTNTDAFTPSADYHPATKKYVDDAVSGEKLWDRTGTTLEPHNANDSVDIGSGVYTGNKFVSEAASGYSVLEWDSADGKIQVSYGTDHNVSIFNKGAVVISVGENLAGGQVAAGVLYNTGLPLYLSSGVSQKGYLYGGPGGGTDLVLSSNSLEFNPGGGYTKGKVYFGTALTSYFDEVNDDWTLAGNIYIGENVGLGTASYDRPLSISTANNTLAAGEASLYVFGEANKERFELRSSGGDPVFQGKSSKGTIASPKAITSAQYLFALGGSGYDGYSWITANKGLIAIKTYTAWTLSSHSTEIHFETTAHNSTQRYPRMKITHDGDIEIGSSTVSCGDIIMVKGGQVGDPRVTLALSDASASDFSITPSKGNLLLTAAETKAVVINESGVDVDFRVESINLPRCLGVDAGGDYAYSANHYPLADAMYYLGKNDDDTPLAWKGVILKDTTNGRYYRVEVINGTVTATDLTD